MKIYVLLINAKIQAPTLKTYWDTLDQALDAIALAVNDDDCATATLYELQGTRVFNYENPRR